VTRVLRHASRGSGPGGLRIGREASEGPSGGAAGFGRRLRGGTLRSSGRRGEAARAMPLVPFGGRRREVENRPGGLAHFRSGNRQEHCRREKPRTGPGGEPQESWSSREGSACSVVGEALERRSSALSESGRGKRRREGDGKPPPRRSGNALERQMKPMRVSARSGESPVGYGSLRGARPWSCGATEPPGPQSRRTRCQKQHEGTDAERRKALRGGKALKGEPHEWHRPSRSEGAKGGNRQEGGKPWRRNEPGLESREVWTFALKSL
jgi:hypothetical protein